MKQIAAIVVLTVLLVISGIFAYRTYRDMKFWKTEYAHQIDKAKLDLSDAEERYNQADVRYRDAMEKFEALDERLKNVRGELIDELHDISVNLQDNGQTAPAPEPSSPIVCTAPTGENIYANFRTGDWRLTADVDVAKRSLAYELNQEFRIRLIKKLDDTYTGEVVELKDGEFYKAYPITYTVEKRYERSELSWIVTAKPILSIGGSYMFQSLTEHGVNGYLLLNFIAKGQTHLDSRWRFLSLGVGYPTVVVLSPVQWRLGEALPLFQDVYLDSLVGVNVGGKLAVGLGISSTF